MIHNNTIYNNCIQLLRTVNLEEITGKVFTALLQSGDEHSDYIGRVLPPLIMHIALRHLAEKFAPTDDHTRSIAEQTLRTFTARQSVIELEPSTEARYAAVQHNRRITEIKNDNTLFVDAFINEEESKLISRLTILKTAVQPP